MQSSLNNCCPESVRGQAHFGTQSAAFEFLSEFVESPLKSDAKARAILRDKSNNMPNRRHHT
jgi:hypothetical protein